MANDNYKIWKPAVENTDGLHFFELHDKLGSLNIYLKKFGLPDKVLRIKFDGVVAYRVVQEAGRLKTINDNPFLSTFNTSTSSVFLRWVREESGGIFDEVELIHYAICNSDNIIDVIIDSSPIDIEWITTQSLGL